MSFSVQYSVVYDRKMASWKLASLSRSIRSGDGVTPCKRSGNLSTMSLRNVKFLAVYADFYCTLPAKIDAVYEVRVGQKANNTLEEVPVQGWYLDAPLPAPPLIT